MAARELSLDQIRDYFIEKGGIVSNGDVVRHFRRYLTDPENRGKVAFAVLFVDCGDFALFTQ